MSLKSLLGRSGVLVASFSAFAGCSVYDESLIGEVTPNECTVGQLGCVPSRPAASTSSASDAMDASYAMRDVLIAQYNDSLSPMDPAQPWRSIGFDMDGVNTTSRSGPMSCQNQFDPDAGAVEAFPIDGNNGIDNAFGGALYANFVGQLYPNLQDGLCCNQRIGRGTLIVRIRNWNGQQNDASISVSIMISKDATSTTEPVQWNSIDGAKELVLSSNGSTPAPLPSWTPDTDTYYIGTNDISGGDVDMPKHEDTNAYVRDGYVVMALNPLQPIKLYLGYQHGISIGLQGGRLVAHLSADGAYIDSGTMGGRMGQAELKDAATRLIGSQATQDDCNQIVQTIGPLIKAYGDVLADGQVNDSSPCNALSVGVKFRGVRTRALRVADEGVCIAYPMCDDGVGVPACKLTADDTTCPWGTSTCTIPAWSGP